MCKQNLYVDLVGKNIIIQVNDMMILINSWGLDFSH